MDTFLNYVLHIDVYLLSFIADFGAWTYLLLFLIIFCETGLVVTPFLPGDSLLFTAGSIAAQANAPLSFKWLFLLLFCASTLGNKINYMIGRAIGPRIFKVKNSKFFNPLYLEKAHQYYEKHGGKTIIIARFMPIIRTFVPFVAGVSYMSIGQFTIYNIVSAILWIGSMLLAGYYFGALPFVQKHFSFFIYGIIFVSLIPAMLSFIMHVVKYCRPDKKKVEMIKD